VKRQTFRVCQTFVRLRLNSQKLDFIKPPKGGLKGKKGKFEESLPSGNVFNLGSTQVRLRLHTNFERSDFN
jgi:hypothetical protein